MLVKVVKKAIHIKNLNIERTLPINGTVTSKKGDIVEPFTKLGMAKFSYGVMNVDLNLKLAKGKNDNSYFYEGEKVGKVNGQSVYSPFNGSLFKQEDKYVLKQEERDFWLLAGVWGQVQNVVENRSVLIKSQSLDLSLAISTDFSYSGEFVVFPNPSELLELQYMEKFARDVFGKIIYAGDYASYELISRAVELGALGILAGSADRRGFVLAKQNEMFLGVFTCFGYTATPKPIYDRLKEISNRYVFVQAGLPAQAGILRIPVPGDFMLTKLIKDAGNFEELERGMVVSVLQAPYFGYSGQVTEIQGDEIYVKIFDSEEESIMVKYPNLIILDL